MKPSQIQSKSWPQAILKIGEHGKMIFILGHWRVYEWFIIQHYYENNQMKYLLMVGLTRID